MAKIDTEELHDFCLAWIMESDSEEIIKAWWESFNGAFEEFEKEAKKKE